MSLARFFDRTADSLVSAIRSDRAELEAVLNRTVVRFTIEEPSADELAQQVGFLFATNLAARLYPTLDFRGPQSLIDHAAELALSINPRIDISRTNAATHTLAWSTELRSSGVAVAADGWNVHIDPTTKSVQPAEPITCMAAGALGIGELFRMVFGDHLRTARTEPRAVSWNIITGGEPTSEVPPLRDRLDLQRLHLAGCGAIGQAFVATLTHAAVGGTLVAHDPETVDLSNIQRYVLTRDSSEGAAKVDLVAGALESSQFAVERVQLPWSIDGALEAERVVVALDSAEARIAVQAGLPREIYNAYTQPLDLGWSRHERFGIDPCLACIYWPTRERRSRADEIAHALGEDRVRILGYLLTSMPVGRPLPAGWLAANRGSLMVNDDWARRSLLGDLVDRGAISAVQEATWSADNIDGLYRGAVCGGAVIPLAHSEAGREHLDVPLAHQTAMAGIMLAIEVIASRSEALRPHRPKQVASRLDMLRGPGPPYGATMAPNHRCICQDAVFRGRYDTRWR